MIEGCFKILHSVSLSPGLARLDGRKLFSSPGSANFLSDLYHHLRAEYPKFFKMDVLCKTGFLAAEILLEAEKAERFVMRNDRAVLLCNASSSITTDRKFIEGIANIDDFYPQPSLFVYTLPNIVTGEIAIRNKFSGETSLYVIEKRDDGILSSLIERAFTDDETLSAVAGWVDAASDSEYEAELFLINKHL